MVGRIRPQLPAAETADRWITFPASLGGTAGFVLARCCCSACCKAISVATLNQQRTRALFDGRTASNVGTVATGIPRMTTTIDRVDCDMMKRVRTRLGSHGAACNFHDHNTAGIARHVRFRLADASA
jgi:hypothetical protein